MTVSSIAATGLNEEALIANIAKSVRAIFSAMVFINCVEDVHVGGMVCIFDNSTSALVGLGGEYSGMIGMHFPAKMAREVTASMLGMQVDEVGKEDINDAVGELTNMLAGDVKMLLLNSGSNVHLSTPSIISGTQYMIETISDSEAVIVPFMIGNEKLLATVQIERN